MKKLLAAGLLTASLLPQLAQAEQQSAIAFSAGAFEAFQSEKSAAEIGV